MQYMQQLFLVAITRNQCKQKSSALCSTDYDVIEEKRSKVTSVVISLATCHLRVGDNSVCTTKTIFCVPFVARN